MKELRVSPSALVIALLNGAVVAGVILSITVDRSVVDMLLHPDDPQLLALTPFLLIWFVLGAAASLSVYVGFSLLRSILHGPQNDQEPH